jgi:membrane protein
MAQVWQLPPDQRPDFWHRILRSLGFFGVLVIGITLAAALSGFGTFGSHRALFALISEALATLVSVVVYVALFRVFTPRAVATRCLLLGAIDGALMWTVLQAFGGYIVGHHLKGASATYGLFGVVLGLLTWLYLVAQTIVYAAELNTVVSGHLWPRSVAGSAEPVQSPASRERAA